MDSTTNSELVFSSIPAAAPSLVPTHSASPFPGSPFVAWMPGAHDSNAGPAHSQDAKAVEDAKRQSTNLLAENDNNPFIPEPSGAPEGFSYEKGIFERYTEVSLCEGEDSQSSNPKKKNAPDDSACFQDEILSDMLRIGGEYNCYVRPNLPGRLVLKPMDTQGSIKLTFVVYFPLRR
jgi:hypothetical protein